MTGLDNDLMYLRVYVSIGLDGLKLEWLIN